MNSSIVNLKINKIKVKKFLLLVILLLHNIAKTQSVNCTLNVCNDLCQTCDTILGNLPRNQTYNFNSTNFGIGKKVCISGNIGGNTIINVSNVVVCFLGTAQFNGNTTINVVSGNVCVLEGAASSAASNVNISGSGFVYDCSTEFKPQYSGTDPGLCDSLNVDLPIHSNITLKVNESFDSLNFQWNSINNIIEFMIINSKSEILKTTTDTTINLSKIQDLYLIIGLDFNGKHFYSNWVHYIKELDTQFLFKVRDINGKETSNTNLSNGIYFINDRKVIVITENGEIKLK